MLPAAQTMFPCSWGTGGIGYWLIQLFKPMLDGALIINIGAVCPNVIDWVGNFGVIKPLQHCALLLITLIPIILFILFKRLAIYISS